MKPSDYHGLLVMDKPGGMTSRAVVNRAQGWFPRGTRLGHTGTLDPLATGVLVLCVGQATRLTEYVQDMSKTYQTTIDLSRRSATLDIDAPEIEHIAFAEPHPDHATVECCLREFVGEIDQVPPAYSAAKVEGRRAYELARSGADVLLKSRRVRIHEIELLAYDYPLLELRVHCGKGTYIRSLARDIGHRLGRAGLIASLRRTRVGPFEASAALPMDIDAETVRAYLLPLSVAVAELPHVRMELADTARLRQGQPVALPSPLPVDGEEAVAVFDAANNLVTVCIADPRQRLLRPDKVFSEHGR